MTALDIYLLGVWQLMGPDDPDVLGELQPHARFWLRHALAAHSDYFRIEAVR